MNLKLLKGDVEMLDVICTGFDPSAVVGQLVVKYRVSGGVCGWFVRGD